MKKLSMALALGLAGCANGTAPINVPAVDVSGTITEIQTLAVQACGFMPAVNTILQIINVAPAQVAGQIATAICGTVTKKGAAHWSYQGVRVEGQFVR